MSLELFFFFKYPSAVTQATNVKAFIYVNTLYKMVSVSFYHHVEFEFFLSRCVQQNLPHKGYRISMGHCQQRVQTFEKQLESASVLIFSLLRSQLIRVPHKILLGRNIYTHIYILLRCDLTKGWRWSSFVQLESVHIEEENSSEKNISI